MMRRINTIRMKAMTTSVMDSNVATATYLYLYWMRRHFSLPPLSSSSMLLMLSPWLIMDSVQSNDIDQVKSKEGRGSESNEITVKRASLNQSMVW